MDKVEILKKYCKQKYGNEVVIKTYSINEVKDIIDFTKKQLLLHGVSTRTFRFSGMKDGEKFVKEMQAADRESAIANFELTYPDLTWRFSTDIT